MQSLLEGDGFDLGALWQRRELRFVSFVVAGAELQHRAEASKAGDDRPAGFRVITDFPAAADSAAVNAAGLFD